MANKVEQFRVVWSPGLDAIFDTKGLALRSYSLHLARGEHPLMEERTITHSDWKIIDPIAPKKD